VAQRAGSVLAAVLEPADDLVRRQRLSDRFGDVGWALVGQIGVPQPGAELVVAPALSERRRRHGLYRLTAELRQVQRTAQRGAGVAGRRLPARRPRTVRPPPSASSPGS
jgi:hypothetical protein